MRVFYEDYEEISKRRYYVKIDNVDVPDNLKTYKAIEALTIDELKTKIIEHYGFNKINKNNIELWTNNGYNGIRLDNMKEIPSDIECIWIRITLNKVE